MVMTIERVVSFKSDVEDKIDILLDDFASGAISREHFDIIYARYSRQLSIAEDALENNDLNSLQRIMNEIPTMALHAAMRGKALGMAIIHHYQMDTIRTFGIFELDIESLSPILRDLNLRLQMNNRDYTEIYKLIGNTWVIVCTLEHTTLVTLFRNEPAAKQVQELERRHRDFESANRNILNLDSPDPDTLVYPVELFVRTS